MQLHVKTRVKNPVVLYCLVVSRANTALQLDCTHTHGKAYS